MVFSIFIPGNLISMANLLAAVPNDKQVSFYKDASGNMQSQTVEFSTVTQNTGYAFQFVDGSVIYTVPPIASYLAIPWVNVLTGALYDTTNIVLWLDASEPKSINVTLQKWISKYTNFMTIENTPTYVFTNPTNTIDLSAQGAIESYDSLPIKQYFKFGIVFSITNLILTNNTIFQHDRVSIRLTQQTSPDTTVNYMIGLYDNGVFKKGVALSATVGFKYFVYCDNTAILIVSGNTSVSQSGSTAFNTSGTAKVYIGQESNGTNNSYIKVHDLLYYTSTSNNLAMTNVNMYTYFSTKWALSTYADIHNIAPATWTNVYSRGDRRSIITIATNFAITGGNGGTIQNWVDGSIGSAQCFYYPGGQAVSGKYMGFTFAVAQKVTGFKIISSGTDTPKTFDFQGSTNGSTWVSLGTFTYLDPAFTVMVGGGQIVPDTDFVNDSGYPVPVDTHLVSNATAYQYYRMMGVSGTTSGSPYEYEILFMIAS